ncbi:collagen alpha-4(IV) chain-like [Meriones unguiculatus]|uniref:collagen alpha-4(IV) chain-like n=1 Tax=Meriones unguiculatus TaxID=10047 RepID=UPI000B4EA054|nr:collagen alpha-4(IV) chain-like [Meriones unguiculatus]
MEGPGCLRTAGSAVRRAPLGAPALGGSHVLAAALPRRALGCAPGRSGGEGLARTWGPPGHQLGPRPRFLACPSHEHQQPPVEEPLRARGGHGRRPGRPRRLRHAPREHLCSDKGHVGALSAPGPWASESHRRGGRPGVPGSLPAFPAGTHTSTHSRPAAGAREPAARPRNLYFPLIRRARFAFAS